MTPRPSRIVLIGNVEPQTSAALTVIAGYDVLHISDPDDLWQVSGYGPDLIVVAGWRRLIPPDILALAPTVGFHSAKLPEYPGRAPVPWALIRGDKETANTMLYLDDGVDSGDIIDSRRIPILKTDTPERLYAEMADTLADMLREHLPALLDGTAPRTPQDLSRRGPLTTADGWERLRWSGPPR